MTNAERIRAMTDEELAHQINLNRQVGCERCHAWKRECDEPLQDESVGAIARWCERCWIEWLKQEVDDGD